MKINKSLCHSMGKDFSTDLMSIFFPFDHSRWIPENTNDSVVTPFHLLRTIDLLLIIIDISLSRCWNWRIIFIETKFSIISQKFSKEKRKRETDIIDANHCQSLFRWKRSTKTSSLINYSKNLSHHKSFHIPLIFDHFSQNISSLCPKTSLNSIPQCVQ